MTINGIINKVRPKTQVSVNGAAFSGINGIRQYGYDKWGMTWNGNHFAPPELDSVLYLPGVPGFGSTIFDFSGSGNDGSITGALWKQLPTSLPYLDFDGAGDIVTIPAASSINMFGKTVLSASAWIYPESDGGGDSGHIISKRTNGYFFYVQAESASKIYLAAFVMHATTNAEAGADSSSPITINAWHHVAFVYNEDSDKKVKLYIDASLASLGSDTAGVGALKDDTGDDLRIGNRAATDRTFDGGIALEKIFSKALSASEIQNHYAQERHLFGV